MNEKPHALGRDGARALVAVDRAAHELRRGRPVLIAGAGESSIALAAEYLTGEALAGLRRLAAAQPSLALSEHGASVLHIGPTGHDTILVPLAAAMTAEGLPTVLGDAGRLRQILINLVGNAVKFTASGSVRVVVRLAATGSSAGHSLELAVEDTGPGLDREQQRIVFEPFTQADASTSRLYGGSGLGLSICQRLAGLLGGTLAVASAPGVGSTFTVRIPLIPAESDNATESPVGGVSSSGTPGTILVVEDNPVNQAVVQRQLDALGHTVITVDGGLRALELLATDAHVDLVLMDCQMPGMDGFTATRRIRELDSGHARLPIVAMTANAMREDRDACLAAGMDDYLAKPVRSDELKQMLDRWIAAGRAAHVAHVPSAPAQPSVAPVIDRSVMDGLVADLGGDPSVIDEFAGIFLRELPTRQAAAVAALADGDRSVLRERAHALRSPSRALGLARLDDVCERIERAAINGNIDTARSLEKELLTACDETAAAISSLIAPGR